MTGRTHDLAAFTALTYVIATSSLSSMTLATAFIAFSANMIGGLAPDIDQPTATLWRRIRAGSVLGRIIHPLLGGHRYISHSILGVFLFGYVLSVILGHLGKILLVDMNVVWWAFMIGFVSHLFMDIFTRDGLPLLFPIPLKFGIPPFRLLRIRTSGIVEKSFVFPMLLLMNIYLIYTHYGKFLDFFKNQIK